jgi:hypothetical protein
MATLPLLRAQKRVLRKAISTTLQLLPALTLEEQCKHDFTAFREFLG